MTAGKTLSDRRVVIVGAGHAGGTAAALLRQAGYAGELVVLGEETYAPYQRPPLSKAFLKAEADVSALLLKAPRFYEEHNINLRVGVRVVSIDRQAKRVRTDGGDDEAYDILILATGAHARRLDLPGSDAAGIMSLRTIADALALRDTIGSGRSIAIVGAGYVGLEVAASARASGAAVSVIEREGRCLARVASPEVSAFFEAKHREKGVGLRTHTDVAAFESRAGGAVGAVVLANGERIACDAVIVGVGARCCDDLARDAGLQCDGGVLVDDVGRTSDASIFAIGDVARRPMAHYGGALARLESVPNALEQAKLATAAILDLPSPRPEVPWFWSDQYDVKMQIAGIALGEAAKRIVRQTSSSVFAVFHVLDDRVLAVEAINAPGDFFVGRQMIAEGRPAPLDRLPDPTIPIKSLLL